MDIDSIITKLIQQFKADNQPEATFWESREDWEAKQNKVCKVLEAQIRNAIDKAIDSLYTD
jgi:hypothetical protein